MDSQLTSLIDCFVFSHVDYCNALFASCTSTSILKLQRIIYSAARLVKKLPRHHHLSHTVQDFGWLRVRQCIKFKVCCLVHRIVYGLAPTYLQSLVSPAPSKTCTAHLRSHSSIRLHCPISSSVHAQAAFCHSAPRLWNSLPNCIKSISNYRMFKRHLKAYLL